MVIIMHGLSLRKMSIQHLADVHTLRQYGCQMERTRRIHGFWTVGRPKVCYPLTFQMMWIYRGIYGWIGTLDRSALTITDGKFHEYRGQIL